MTSIMIEKMQIGHDAYPTIYMTLFFYL